MLMVRRGEGEDTIPVRQSHFLISPSDPKGIRLDHLQGSSMFIERSRGVAGGLFQAAIGRGEGR